MTNPDLHFEFYLAQKLGGMTVAELRERMSNDEFVHWVQYYALEAQQMELQNKPAVRLTTKGGRSG